MWKGRKPNIFHFHVFGCEWLILNNKKNIGKFCSKLDKAIFVGYSLTSKAYKVSNLRTQVMKESMHDVFNDNNSLKLKQVVGIDDELERIYISNKHAEKNVLEAKWQNVTNVKFTEFSYAICDVYLTF